MHRGFIVHTGKRFEQIADKIWALPIAAFIQPSAWGAALASPSSPTPARKVIALPPEKNVTTTDEHPASMSNPSVFRIAAITGIVFSLVGKVSALLSSIPQAVLGGIMLLLFGTIAGAGISNLLNSKVDFGSSRNIVIISVTLTTGIGGAIMQFGNFSLAGIGLSALIAVVLNLILPEPKKSNETTKTENNKE